MASFESKFAIGDEVAYNTVSLVDMLCNTGTILKVSFTKKAVTYDILDDHTNEINKNVVEQSVAKLESPVAIKFSE